MVVIPKVQATLHVRHQGGVGVGGAGLEIGATPIAVSDDGSIRYTVTAQPVVAFIIGVGELFALGIGDRDRQIDWLALTCHGSPLPAPRPLMSSLDGDSRHKPLPANPWSCLSFG
jgi:hypothetical protein